MPSSVVHFAIPTDDVRRAKKSYQVVSVQISDPWEMDYFLVETKKKGEEGINGGLMQRKMPDHMNYLAIDSIETYCKKVEKAGGVVVLPKQEIGPNMGWIAAFKDTGGPRNLQPRRL